MGDEILHTQRGNNNPYCHDSELTWVDWTPRPHTTAMLAVARKLVAMRKEHGVFRRRGFLRGASLPASRGKDITWLRTDGREMTGADWAAPPSAAIAFRLDGDTLDFDVGTEARDDSFLVLMNGEKEAVEFVLPGPALGEAWKVLFDSDESRRASDVVSAAGRITVGAGALVAMIERG
jgi:glycogen operon protein